MQFKTKIDTFMLKSSQYKKLAPSAKTKFESCKPHEKSKQKTPKCQNAKSNGENQGFDILCFM